MLVREMKMVSSMLHVFSRSLLLLFFFLLLSCNGNRVWGCPPSIPCGDLGDLRFPFTSRPHSECGLLVIDGCQDDPGSTKSIQNNNRWFNIVNGSLTQSNITVRDDGLVVSRSSITIRDDNLYTLLSSRSCEVLGYGSSNTFRIDTPLASSQVMYSATLLKCKHSIDPRPSYVLPNSTVCGNDTFYGVSDASKYKEIQGCSLIELPLGGPNVVLQDPNTLLSSLTADIPIQINLSPNCSHCNIAYGGLCRIDNSGRFYCHTPRKTRKTITIAVASVIGALGAFIVLAWYFRRHFYNKENPTHQIIEAFLKNHGHLAAKRFSYLEVKKATNSFKDKLGQGGYGSVYKGKLSDGTLVAVKVLSESKGNGEEFINEVASISVTSHVNIVELLGFCLEDTKRALIYKYMPNGSVEKFIYEGRDSKRFNPNLTCKTMYKIAIGVARGLDYLHKGCNSKIVHFDIKPHNILLDEDFCPKISDFGLAKICMEKESILSLMIARGTIGYIAPEVFSRNFGEVSHKSDVYSYGMMVLEMIGERSNMNIKDESSSEMYFPHWIYRRLEQNQEPELQCIKNEIDKETIQKMIVVSLWCIQTDPSNRPTMSKVVDMMESTFESLQMPPKPYLSSPPRSSPLDSTNSSLSKCKSL
ncbi:LEAF RUST 10 DISEASE-RESISTANCE LOCUS RECEPTOR-LIKE PROTEIN KINASE-like 2.1 [Arachis stenosperma]|uniref:LEAF RUST 10 DISEASE-RESISTANCE LOCUS RECEPTOR-LIKE PROTEIN KINASE-like 2.1 n=1 Tax=Arachis stenosperma TaxID=217475 RepID=UPI0025AD5525|nr:LEAF RUST 10 DISEASE-RESISTANCE LOCUS RECEPTOR-LIKE PROTEIN KINASE-like 2.1 [Arachis stenosperma]